MKIGSQQLGNKITICRSADCYMLQHELRCAHVLKRRDEDIAERDDLAELTNRLIQFIFAVSHSRVEGASIALVLDRFASQEQELRRAS